MKPGYNCNAARRLQVPEDAPADDRVLQYEEVLRSPRKHALELARFLRMERSTDAMVSSFTQNVRASRRPPPSEEQEAYAAGLRLQACDPQVVWEQGRGG